MQLSIVYIVHACWSGSW